MYQELSHVACNPKDAKRLRGKIDKVTRTMFKKYPGKP